MPPFLSTLEGSQTATWLCAEVPVFQIYGVKINIMTNGSHHRIAKYLLTVYEWKCAKNIFRMFLLNVDIHVLMCIAPTSKNEN